MNSIIGMTIITIICVAFIIKMIDKNILGLYKNERERTRILFEILESIKRQLTLAQLKSCPEEERITILKELINWIEQIQGVSNVKK